MCFSFFFFFFGNMMISFEVVIKKTMAKLGRIWFQVTIL